MTFSKIAKFLFLLMEETSLREMMTRKNIHLSVDTLHKQVILRAKIFSENGYVSPQMKIFIAEKRFANGLETFLTISKKPSEVHLIRKIPYDQENISWRQAFLEFSQEALSSSLELRKISSQESLLFKEIYLNLSQ